MPRGRYSSGERQSRGSRLEYRTRFLAAPPAGILEQKRETARSLAPFSPHSSPVTPADSYFHLFSCLLIFATEKQ